MLNFLKNIFSKTTNEQCSVYTNSCTAESQYESNKDSDQQCFSSLISEADDKNSKD